MIIFFIISIICYIVLAILTHTYFKEEFQDKFYLITGFESTSEYFITNIIILFAAIPLVCYVIFDYFTGKNNFTNKDL